MQDFTETITVNEPPENTFAYINAVTKWWTENAREEFENLSDAFTIRFWRDPCVHEKIVALAPGKRIAWFVTDSNLNFINDKSEWT